MHFFRDCGVSAVLESSTTPSAQPASPLTLKTAASLSTPGPWQRTRRPERHSFTISAVTRLVSMRSSGSSSRRWSSPLVSILPPRLVAAFFVASRLVSGFTVCADVGRPSLHSPWLLSYRGYPWFGSHEHSGLLCRSSSPEKRSEACWY